MKKLILMMAVLLGGCAAIAPANSNLTPAQQLAAAQGARNAACQVWNVAFQAALAARKANVASPTLVQQISLADSQFTPICTSALPTDIGTLQTQTVQVMTSMATLELLMKEIQK